MSWWRTLFSPDTPSVAIIVDNSLSASVQDISAENNTFQTRLDASKNLMKIFSKEFFMKYSGNIFLASFSRDVTIELPFSDDSTLIDNVIS